MPILYDIKDDKNNMKRLYKLDGANVKLDLYWGKVGKVSDDFLYLYGRVKTLAGCAYKNSETGRTDYRYDGKDEFIAVPLSKSDDAPTIEKFFFEEFSKDRYSNLFQATINILDNQHLLGQVCNSELPQPTRDALLESFIGNFTNIGRDKLEENPDLVDPQLSPPKNRGGSGGGYSRGETTEEMLKAKKAFLISEFPNLVPPPSTGDSEKNTEANLEAIASNIALMRSATGDASSQDIIEITLLLLAYFS